MDKQPSLHVLRKDFKFLMDALQQYCSMALTACFVRSRKEVACF